MFNNVDEFGNKVDIFGLDAEEVTSVKTGYEVALERQNTLLERQEQIEAIKRRTESEETLKRIYPNEFIAAEETAPEDAEETIKDMSNVNIPLNTHKSTMANIKDNVYKTYTIMSMYSKNGRYKDMIGQNYIYKNDLKAHIDEFNLFTDKPITDKTLNNHIKTLANADIPLINIVDTGINGIAYQINFSKETEGKYFTTINHEILQELITYTNTQVLKLYAVLSYRCNTNTFTYMDRLHLCEQIGIKPSTRNADKYITGAIKVLAKLGLIKVHSQKVNGKNVPNGYMLTTLDEYRAINKKALGGE